VMERECFWGCVLSKAKRECSWNAEEDDDDSEIDINHTLRLSQACLDANVKDKDRNVVQVTTTDVKDTECTSTIVSLRLGLLEQCALGVNFNAPAKFKLVEGSGPVHLVGNYIQGVSEDLLSTKDSCCEDEESEEAPFNILKPKRPPAVSTDEPKSKKAKVEEEKDEDESEEQSDEEMEVEIKAPVSAANVKSKQPQAKPAVKENAKISEKVDDDEAEESEEEDSEEEDESEEEESEEEDESEEEEEEEEEESDEEESDDDDDDEDDDSEEDEDEEIVTALVGKKGKDASKKPLTNGVAQSSKKGDSKPPAKVAPPKTDKKQEKTPVAAPSKTDKKQEKTPVAATPKADKTQEKTPGKKSRKSPAPPKDIKAIKEQLLKMQNLPKTPEKFKNFMKGFKVEDDSKVKELWKWVEENRK